MAHKKFNDTSSVNVSGSIIGSSIMQGLKSIPRGMVPVALMPVKTVKGLVRLTEPQESLTSIKNTIEMSIQSGTEKALVNVMKKEGRTISSSMASSMMNVINKAQTKNGAFGSSLFEFDLTNLLNKTLGNPLVIGLFGKEFGKQIVEGGIVPGIEKLLTKLGAGENVAKLLSKTLFAGYFVKDLKLGSSKLLKTIDVLSNTYEKAKTSIEKTVDITKKTLDTATDKLINDKQSMKKLILASMTGIGYPIIELFSPIIDKFTEKVTEKTKNIFKNIFTSISRGMTKRFTEFLVKISASRTFSKIPGLKSLVQLISAKDQAQELIGGKLGEIVGSLVKGDFSKIPKIASDTAKEFNTLIDTINGATNAFKDLDDAIKKDKKAKEKREKKGKVSLKGKGGKIDTTLQETDGDEKPSFIKNALSKIGFRSKISKKEKTTKDKKDKKEEEKKNPLLKFLSKLLGPIAALLGGIAGFFKDGIKSALKKLITGIGKGLWSVTKFLSKGIWGAIKFLGNNLIWKPIKFLAKSIWKPIKFLGEKLIWNPIKYLSGKVWKAATYLGGKFKDFVKPLTDKLSSLARPATSRIGALGKYLATTSVSEAGLGATLGAVGVAAAGGWAAGKALYNNDWVRKNILDPTIGRIVKVFANISVNGLSTITDPIKNFFRNIAKFFRRLGKAVDLLIHGHPVKALKILKGDDQREFKGTNAYYDNEKGVVEINGSLNNNNLVNRGVTGLSKTEKHAFLNTDIKLAKENTGRDIDTIDDSGIGLFGFNKDDQLKAMLVNTAVMLPNGRMKKRAKALISKIKNGNYKFSDIKKFFTELKNKYPAIFSKAQLITMENSRMKILSSLKSKGVDISKLKKEDIQKIDIMYQKGGYEMAEGSLLNYLENHNGSTAGLSKFMDKVISTGDFEYEPKPHTPGSSISQKNVSQIQNTLNKKATETPPKGGPSGKTPESLAFYGGGGTNTVNYYINVDKGKETTDTYTDLPLHIVGS